METTESTVGQDPKLIWIKVSVKFQTDDGAWVGVERGAWVDATSFNASIENQYSYLEVHEQGIKKRRKLLAEQQG